MKKNKVEQKTRKKIKIISHIKRYHRMKGKDKVPFGIDEYMANQQYRNHIY